MVEAFRRLIRNQFEAALCTLGTCFDQCPDDAWNAPVVNLAFCQVAFHTLFFADLYLEQSEDTFRQQTFHQNNKAFFRDYEELQDRAQALLYDRQSIKAYLVHCRKKALETVATESADILTARCQFAPRDFTRAELHVYNVRHIQHHAAQLGLWLQSRHQVNVPWVGSGSGDRKMG